MSKSSETDPYHFFPSTTMAKPDLHSPLEHDHGIKNVIAEAGKHQQKKADPFV
jgi:hypothetical protein